jgi:hypothetical protein
MFHRIRAAAARALQPAALAKRKAAVMDGRMAGPMAMRTISSTATPQPILKVNGGVPNKLSKPGVRIQQALYSLLVNRRLRIR